MASSDTSVAQVNTTMRQVVASLKDYVNNALATVNGTWSFIGADSSKDAITHNLTDYAARIDRLGGEQMALVQTGDWPFEKWSNVAQLLHDGIADQISDTDEWSMSGVLSNTASATASDTVSVVRTVEQKVQEALPGWSTVTILVICIALAMIAIAVIHVT